MIDGCIIDQLVNICRPKLFNMNKLRNCEFNDICV